MLAWAAASARSFWTEIEWIFFAVSEQSPCPDPTLVWSSPFLCWSDSHRYSLVQVLHKVFDLLFKPFFEQGERLGSERKSESPPYVVSSKNGLSESWSGKRQIESKGKGAEKGEIVRKGRGASPYYKGALSEGGRLRVAFYYITSRRVKGSFLRT